MIPEQKKLGELLVEAQLITPAQLQEALRYQRISGGRMGSNLVSLGLISEDTLMDFLSRQTGVPRVDLRTLEVPPQVLERIPRRLADQMNILPVAFKEPKSLVLAMADPSDLNAMDSARFAAGLNIEPMVATHSALKLAIVEQYRKLDILSGRTVDIGATVTIDDALPVPLDLAPKPLDIQSGRAFQPYQPPAPVIPPPMGLPPVKAFPRDPFFDNGVGLPDEPLSFLSQDPGLSRGQGFQPAPNPFVTPVNPFPAPPAQPFAPSPSEQAATAANSIPGIVHDRGSNMPRSRTLESYKTRTLVFGLIRLLQRRGVVSEEELTRLIQNLLETREIRDDGSEF